MKNLLGRNIGFISLVAACIGCSNKGAASDPLPLNKQPAAEQKKSGDGTEAASEVFSLTIPDFGSDLGVKQLEISISSLDGKLIQGQKTPYSPGKLIEFAKLRAGKIKIRVILIDETGSPFVQGDSEAEIVAGKPSRADINVKKIIDEVSGKLVIAITQNSDPSPGELIDPCGLYWLSDGVPLPPNMQERRSCTGGGTECSIKIGNEEYSESACSKTDTMLALKESLCAAEKKPTLDELRRVKCMAFSSGINPADLNKIAVMSEEHPAAAPAVPVAAPAAVVFVPISDTSRTSIKGSKWEVKSNALGCSQATTGTITFGGSISQTYRCQLIDSVYRPVLVNP